MDPERELSVWTDRVEAFLEKYPALNNAEVPANASQAIQEATALVEQRGQLPFFGANIQPAIYLNASHRMGELYSRKMQYEHAIAPLPPLPSLPPLPPVPAFLQSPVAGRRRRLSKKKKTLRRRKRSSRR